MRTWAVAVLLVAVVLGVNSAPDDDNLRHRRKTTRRTTLTKSTTTTAKPTTTTISPATTPASCPLSGKAYHGRNRIVGGIPVTIAEFPYQLSFRSSGSHFCGATIISQSWAVTAAHCCVNPLATLTLKAGSAKRTSGKTVHTVVVMTPHKSYDSSTQDYDICLLKVAKPFIYKTNEVAPVELPSATEVPASAGANSTVSGWGAMGSGATTLPEPLMAVSVPIVSQTSCETSYGANAITANMFCAGFPSGGKDSCQGDSGGPLVVSNTCGRKVLVGVVSWGYSCAQPNFPGVYSNVIALRPWIKEISGV